jgi:polysaccharide deacetylase family protein (PEP-CTERM system associated)
MQVPCVPLRSGELDVDAAITPPRALRPGGTSYLASDSPAHALTIDVLEYFQIPSFNGVISLDDWEVMPSRIERGVHLLLEVLARYEASATFFTLGWIGARHPHVVRAIVNAGHELAVLGWWPRPLVHLTPRQVRHEVRDSKARLEDISGGAVAGFRAPDRSLRSGGHWAFQVLIEEGYQYDSSLGPTWRGRLRGARSLLPHWIRSPTGAVLEVPPTPVRLAGVGWMGLPRVGGESLRLLPYALTRGTVASHASKRTAAVLHVRTWEADVIQPLLCASPLRRLRYSTRRRVALPRLERLLSEFPFTSVARRFPWYRAPHHLDGCGI